MVIAYIFRNPAVWIPPMLVQIVSYILILRKMGKRPYMGIIPVLGDMEMTKDLFRRMRTFWRPAIITLALMLTALYLKDSEISLLLKLISAVVYGIFVARLYWRLTKQFGKGRIFAIFTILIPVIFLPILAFGKSTYLGRPAFRPGKQHGKVQRFLRTAALVIISGVEILALILVCFGITVLVRPIRPINEYFLNDTLQQIASVEESDQFVSRSDTLGENYAAAVSEQRTRDYFFGDHSNVSKAVVMEYIIGSDLEDRRGCASLNIAEMKNTTAMGDGLDFVIQAGGSDRWFTDGIKDSSVGRYLMREGELINVADLDPDTCMSEPENLKDFIVWTKEHYPADRYMLILWDHGGGFASGYGYDDLNKRKGDSSTMTASEIIGAIRDSGVKFDLIGFDACLMQNIEYANALEPYADYYLASEESEPGEGWFYTAGFKKLAEDPTISTEEFGRAMVSSYDELYRTIYNGDPQPTNTLSLVDLTLVKPVYEKIEEIYKDKTAEIKDDTAVFGNMSAARSRAYEFMDGEQVDLISYLDALKKADYNERVLSDSEIDEVIDMVRACVVFRNKDSAEGINGLAIDFPYGSLGTYSYEYEQLKAVKYRAEEKFYNTFCSIIAAQKMQAFEGKDDDSFIGTLERLASDYSEEEWYIKGFEDYASVDMFVDIPVQELENGYLAELPVKAWDSIIDCQTDAYMPVEDELMYIGREHFASEDDEGHPLVVASDSWAHMNGNLVCYKADSPMETEEGTVYKGSIPARLNGIDDITIHVEWSPVPKGSNVVPEGKVVGYSVDSDDIGFFMQRGLKQFETGDSLEFMFDFYDIEGNYLRTEPYGGTLNILTDELLSISDKPFDRNAEVEYYGILTDVYQRDFMTEVITRGEN